MTTLFFNFLAYNVIARHQLLEGAIGGFKEEVYAYSMVTNLCWVLPLIVVVGASPGLAATMV